MKKLIFSLCLLIGSFLCSNLIAQGLEISDNTVFKHVDGTEITIEEFQELIASGDYTMEPILDSQGNLVEIKVIELSEADKKVIAQFPKLKATEQIGTLPPDFDVNDMDGNNFNSDALIGKVTVMKFWFKECVPCVKEMPDLNEVVNYYESNEDVVFLAFGLDNETDINDFLKIHELKYNIIPSAELVRISYDINGFPTHIVVDKAGLIKQYIQGSNLYIKRELIKAIDASLNNTEIDNSGDSERENVIQFSISPDMLILDENGNEISFDTFMSKMDTGKYLPEELISKAGKPYIQLKKTK